MTDLEQIFSEPLTFLQAKQMKESVMESIKASKRSALCLCSEHKIGPKLKSSLSSDSLLPESVWTIFCFILPKPP